MELLTVDEVAKTLKLTPYTIRRLLKESRLKGIKVGAGQQWRIRRDDLDAYLAGSYSNGNEVNNRRDGDVTVFRAVSGQHRTITPRHEITMLDTVSHESTNPSKTLSDLDALADEISAAWEPGLSVKDVIGEIRS